MTSTITKTESPSFKTRDTKTFQPLSPQVDPKITKAKLGSSFGYNFLRNQLSISSWLSIGAAIQLILFLTLKPSYASLPVLAYTIYTIGFLLYTSIATPRMDPNIIYHKTSALVPSQDGSIRNGTSGEKIAVLHLAFKNYSPLGPLAPGYATMNKLGADMFRELDTPHGRKTYGYLGQDSYMQASSAVDSTSSSTLMVIMYFRSLEGVHNYASQSEAHRKGWDWYHGFAKGPGAQNKHLGIMHEVFEAPAGRWETVHVNMEHIGLGRASARLEDGSEISTMVDASRGVLASAKGRVS